MIIIVSVAFLILIMPVFIKCKVDYKHEIKRVYFCNKVYNLITINKGIIALKSFHIVKRINNKITKEPNNKFIFNTKKSEIINDYTLNNVKITVNFACDNNMLSLFEFKFISDLIYRYVKILTYYKKPNLNYKQNIILSNNENFFIKLEFSLFLNLLIVLISVTKLLLEKFFYVFKTKK